MPNIEIHGFSMSNRIFGYEILNYNLVEVSKLQTAITERLMDFPFAKDTVTTTHDSYCRDSELKRAPFLRICDTNLERAKTIAETLKEELEIDIEVLQLAAFYPAEPA